MNKICNRFIGQSNSKECDEWFTDVVNSCLKTTFSTNFLNPFNYFKNLFWSSLDETTIDYIDPKNWKHHDCIEMINEMTKDYIQISNQPFFVLGLWSFLFILMLLILCCKEKERPELFGSKNDVTTILQHLCSKIRKSPRNKIYKKEYENIIVRMIKKILQSHGINISEESLRILVSENPTIQLDNEIY